MAGRRAEQSLPKAILEKSSLRGLEYAWHPDDIPEVIEAARVAGLKSLGGQLQFRLPDATCEIYWIEVDQFGTEVDPDEAARRTLAQFHAIYSKDSWFREGRTFPAVREYEKAGGNLNAAMCFVWYLER
ncbi:hypothetical protein [Henriciella algicola]|uniref:Uncharacterized protein n=1 Tax=Henriciella algicola TaxID=1608422 RepID=A0A399RNA5_9PROT|nr:hypothetical protein [Henriciella algicola]RIJ31292.1 hypothetical protein D1222_03240 [Henriciella algicola]